MGIKPLKLTVDSIINRFPEYSNIIKEECEGISNNKLPLVLEYINNIHHALKDYIDYPIKERLIMIKLHMNLIKKLNVICIDDSYNENDINEIIKFSTKESLAFDEIYEILPDKFVEIYKDKKLKIGRYLVSSIQILYDSTPHSDRKFSGTIYVKGNLKVID